MKKVIFCLFVIAIALASLNNIYAQKMKTSWLDGEWIGIGFQPAALNLTTWNIDLKYNSLSVEFIINYPSFPCSGHWKLIEADKNKATFIEYITEGNDLCLDKETVVVTKIDSQYITISYFLPEKYDGVIAFSTLKKTKENVKENGNK